MDLFGVEAACGEDNLELGIWSVIKSSFEKIPPWEKKTNFNHKKNCNLFQHNKVRKKNYTHTHRERENAKNLLEYSVLNFEKKETRGNWKLIKTVYWIANN